MIVKENIEFKRGVSSKRSLNIGHKSSINNFFRNYAPNAEYEIDANFNITVIGSLFLENTKVSSLPDNLTVTDILYLQNTKISSLPDNLTVKGSLYLQNTPISSLPDNLSVSGKIYKDF